MSFQPPTIEPCAHVGGEAHQVSCEKFLPKSFDPEWFAQNAGPMFEAWVRAEYRGNIRVVAQVFGVSPEAVCNWMRQSSVPNGKVMLGAVIAFPTFRERVERAWQKHLDRMDAAVIRAARERQKARRGKVAA